MSINLLIDTCVWLDIVKNPNDEVILSTIEDLKASGVISFIIPEMIKEEFGRNKDRVKDLARQRLTQEFKKVRKVIESFGDKDNKGIALETLDNVNHKLSIISDEVITSIERVERLFKTAEKIKVPEKLFVRAGERALLKQAPFHRQKNNFADAMLMEIYHYESKMKSSNTYYFITHNFHDFSDSTDNRKIHPDFLEYFDGKRTIYEINIVNALKKIDPECVDENIFEHEWSFETRSLSEIIDSIGEFEQKIWYGRHGVLASSVEEGRIKIVKKSSSKKYNPNEILEEIWEGACKAAEKVEKLFPNDLGPWSDFEWGMLNGKLSALRWILGDDWDILDT